MRYQAAVFAVVFRITGSRDDLEDLAQDSFLRAYDAFPRFEPSGPARPSTWLLTIATRVALDAVKKKSLDTRPLQEGSGFPAGESTTVTVANVFEGRVRAVVGSETLELAAGQSAELAAHGLRQLSEGERGDLEFQLDAAERRAASFAAANDNLVGDVQHLRRVLEQTEKQRAELQSELEGAEDRLAEASGEARRRDAFDLQPEDWQELAKSGSVKFILPCPEGAWPQSQAALDRLGLSGEDWQVIAAAEKNSRERLWNKVRPVCLEAVGVDSVVDAMGAQTCAQVIFNQVLKHEGRDELTAIMKQVGEIRAGLRAEPSWDQQPALMKVFLTLTGEQAQYQEELAQSFGPDEARRLAFAHELCHSRSEFDQPAADPTEGAAKAARPSIASRDLP